MLGQLRKSCRKVVCSWKSSELESTESCEKASRPQSDSVFAQFSVVCMFNWMLGQLRKVVGRSSFEGRSYVRGRAPNLNRLSSVRENAVNPHSQPNSVFAQFPVVCMFNWMLGQLRKAIWRSYVRGRAPNLNRLSRARKYLALSPIQCSRNSQSCVCSIGCSAECLGTRRAEIFK